MRAQVAGQQIGQPVGAAGALAAVGAVVATLALLHVTCTPATAGTGPAGNSERYVPAPGLGAFPERGHPVLLENRP